MTFVYNLLLYNNIMMNHILNATEVILGIKTPCYSVITSVLLRG